VLLVPRMTEKLADGSKTALQAPLGLQGGGVGCEHRWEDRCRVGCFKLI